MCYEALMAPMVYRESCPRRPYLPCYAALRVKAVDGPDSPAGHAKSRARISPYTRFNKRST